MNEPRILEKRRVSVEEAMRRLPSPEGHRFERFTDDLVVWVIFYGPEGGEAALASAP